MDVKTIKLGASDTDGNHCIYYLCPEHIAQHLDTKIKSLIDGKSVRVNRLMLASLSRKLLPHLIEAEDNEIEIMCEFPGETLEILELFVSGKQFLNDLALSNDVAQICENFGIDLDQKCEVVIKEDLGNVFLDNDEPKQEDDTVMFDDDEPKKLYWNSNKGQFQKGPGGRPVKRKRGRPKTKPPAPVVKRPRGRPFKKSKAKPKPAKKVRRKKKNGSDDESDDDEYMPYANMLHKQRVDPGIRQSVDGNKDPLFGFENDDIFQTDENVPKKRQRRQIDLDHIKVEGFIRYPDELSIAFDDHCVWATKVQAIKAYQEKYRKFVRMGYLPKVNPDELRNFQLPQPIESYLRKADFSSQTLNRNAEGKIKCVLCDAFCRTETMLINHQRKFHSEKYVCPTCQRDFEKNQWYQLIRHIYEHSISKGEPLDHECIACGYTASLMSRIDQHRINFGSLHNNECSQCSVTFTSYQEHKIHVDELHEGRWKYRCEYCPETFPAPDLAKKHVYEAHTDKNWICDKCGKGYAEENALKAHVQKCNPGAEFSCDQCEFQTTSSGHLKTHVSLKHTFLPCSVCGKIVPERYMNRHILNQHTENDDKPYPCQYCPKRFPHKKNLEEHENVHTGRKPFACGMCEKSFASAGNMYMHRRMAHFGYKRTK